LREERRKKEPCVDYCVSDKNSTNETVFVVKSRLEWYERKKASDTGHV
jgi:hypothetical protein